MPRVEILIVSHGPDAPWLRYCLQSIRRFTRGFEREVVVYPNRDDELMRPICAEYGADAAPYDEAPSPLGHLDHNVAKCSADLRCPEATHILHVDSDCIFTGPTTPQAFFVDGKPILGRRDWKDAGPAICWREPVERALGWDPKSETMCRLPLIHDARVYRLVREHVEQRHGRPFRQYVLAQTPDARNPRGGFAEFDTLGEMALTRMPDAYHVVTVPPWQALPSPPCRQLWSFSGITPAIRAWLDETLIDGEQRPPPQ